MILNDSDRQWVGAIIERVALETLTAGKNYTDEKLAGHPAHCPNILKMKWLAIGLGVGLGVSFPTIVQGLVKAFAAL